ncbi:cytochrome P450 [Endogone sp. FLAS-F59071]|nr:cytochrome P450 [Endogone sp. FLAS-F59071]|eukprot:RUS21135.1 cytochrome P450 [Endogone sp. FLAS-F59071]
MSQQILNIVTASKDNVSSLAAEYAPRVLSSVGIGETLGCITAAVVLAVAYGIYSTLTVPWNLRHLPYVPFSKIGSAVIRRDATDIIEHKFFIPEYKEHGLVVLWRQGFWQVSVANPEYAKKLLLRLGETGFRLVGRFFGSSNIVFQNGEHWKRHRKIANPAFHRSMPVKLFGNLTQKLFGKIEADGYHIDAHDYMQRCHRQGRSIEDTENSWAVVYNNIMDGLQDPLFLLFPILEKYLLWAFPKRYELHRKMDKLNELFAEVIQNKRVLHQKRDMSVEKEDNEKDLLAMMIEANESEVDGLSDQELRDNLAIFFVAGHDTTANALSSAIYFLATNKNVQQKAREEALAILGDAPEDVFPDVDQTKQFSYINQIIKESLRMFPPASAVLPRRTTADVDLGPYHIPKGSLVSMDIYAMHHNPVNWENPDHFDPGRFAEGGENESKMGSGNGASYSWIPFSNGARQCIGMNFSIAEQRVVLSMLRKFLFFQLCRVYACARDLHLLLISSQVRVVPPCRFHSQRRDEAQSRRPSVALELDDRFPS